MLLEVGLGPGLDSMSPARSRRSASHAAGTHGCLPQKTGRPGLRRGGVGGYNLHSVPPNSPPDCGTVAHQPRSSSTSSRISSTLSYFWISERKAIVFQCTHHRYSERQPSSHANGISYTTGHLALVTELLLLLSTYPSCV